MRIAASVRGSGCVGTDLVVAIGAHQQQMPRLRLGEQIFEEVQRRRIQPLQIVEEQHERVLRLREHAEKPPKHPMKMALRVLRRQIRHRRLFADDELRARGRG